MTITCYTCKEGLENGDRMTICGGTQNIDALREAVCAASNECSACASFCNFDAVPVDECRTSVQAKYTTQYETCMAN